MLWRSQAIFSDAQRQNHREWSQTETQEDPSEHQKDVTAKHFFTLKVTEHWHQVAHGGCGVSLLEYIVNLVLGNWLLVTLLKQEQEGGPENL